MGQVKLGDVIALDTPFGDGEATVVKSPLGVQDTMWDITLPFCSVFVLGPESLMLKNVSSLIKREEESDENSR